ncbi:Small auxin-up RNA [Parasponia andersonii]|uniref:Small auxin-up RNA n=1 Tax=Parasponia andersonii TaxID=3476 RepID=A0A2P5AIP3_PARAD|nr:Small auxin-up RNA [Parasponia andersonii]
MARKWQRMAALSRKRISFSRRNKDLDIAESCTTSSNVTDKGHFVVYTTDDKRFVIPLEYLSHNILRELFRMSEEEFGLSSDGPIRLPCDAVFMDYVIKLIRRGVAKDLEKALLKSIETSLCYSLPASSFHQGLTSQQIPVFGY